MNYEKLRLECQLCFPLYVCSKEIIKKYKPFLDPLEITYTEYIAFMALWEEDHISIKELGHKLFLDSGTLTPLLKKMERQGFVTRNRSTTDERTVYINLTQKGIELQEKASHIPEQMGSCLPISVEEATILHDILHKFLDHINK
ncbi:MarR family winged helix-turn-helix transcriptional regulator [Anaerocolumna sp.]|uniref:MarR family winged helix-turn-helix transcriptional regulator n=1 Tax=Anaerocolumna sp. TaxID=2041569 RepID=UPI0028AE0AB4|nr:MarR family transcriptional regulator [Anaerocolumna sp.]